LGLLDRFKKNSRLDEEDEDDDEIADDEEDEGEEDEENEEEAGSGGGLFGKIRGLGGKLLGRGGDDDEDDDEEDEDDYDENLPARPSPPALTVSNPPSQGEPTPPPAAAEVSRQNLPASPGAVALEDQASPSPASTEDFPLRDQALTSLLGDASNAGTADAPDKIDPSSTEARPEENDASHLGLDLGGIFEKKVEIDQKLRNLAMSQEETPAEDLATELQALLQEWKELTPG